MRRTLGFVLWTVATAVVQPSWNPSALAGDDPTADPKPAQGRGRIVFYFADHKRGGSEGLYVIDPSTDAMTKVADAPSKNGPIALADLRLSPDGRRIAYGEMKNTDGAHAVFTSVWLRDLRPGAPPRKISDIAGWPIWSPDGKQLLVLEFLGDDNPARRYRYRTWKIDDDGSHRVRLPIPDDFQVEDWSRDGRWLTGIVAAPGKSHDYEIVLMHPDGTGRRSLAGAGQRYEPRFSPDSRQVAFVESSADPAKGMTGKSIGGVDLDGKNLRRVYLEPDDAHIGGVAWSPNGKSLVTNLETWGPDEQGIVTLINPRLCIIDVADGHTRFIPHPKATVLGRPEWR